MSGEFIDSNVLIYMLDETAPSKQAAARELVLAGVQNGTATISFQVVQEFLNIATRKLQPPATPSEAQSYLEEFLVPLWHVMPSQALYERAIENQERYGFSFYDSLIVAAAQAAGCTRLYSEDLQHGQRIGSLTIMNPFLS